MWGRLRKKNYVLVKCDPITLDVGGDLRLDDPVHVTLDVECAIQHDKSNPAVAVHSTPKHHTPSVPLVLFSNADVGITLTSAMLPPDLSIPMRETKPGLIGKKKMFSIAGMSTVHHPVEPCSTPLPIQVGALMWASDTQCKSPETITHGLCGYLGIMTSSCFCNSSCGWSPPIP